MKVTSSTTTTKKSSSSSTSFGGKTTSKSSTTTTTSSSSGGGFGFNADTSVSKSGKGTTAQGATYEYQTSGNVDSVEVSFDPSKMNSGFHMDMTVTDPHVHGTTVTTTTSSTHPGVTTYTETTTTTSGGGVHVHGDPNAAAVAAAALHGVANLFAPPKTETVIIKETQVVYTAPKPEEEPEEMWECTTWEEGECCCFKRMEPEKAKRYKKYQSTD